MRILLLLFRSLMASLLNPVYWAAVYLTHRKYHRDGEHADGRTRQSIFTGIAAGSLVMTLICILGLTVQPGLYLALLLPTALLLSRIRPRFCCFAYSGTLLGLWGAADVPGILVIVGVLHVMEGILAALDTAPGEELAYKEGRVVKKMRRVGCWPVPFALLVPVSGEVLGIAMPPWWPLLGSAAGFALCPMTALFLYNAEGRGSVWKLIFYGAALCFLAFCLPQGRIWEIGALLIMFLAHEWILLEV